MFDNFHIFKKRKSLTIFNLIALKLNMVKLHDPMSSELAKEKK